MKKFKQKLLKKMQSRMKKSKQVVVKEDEDEKFHVEDKKI